MKIVLLRHGRPDIDLAERIRASAIPELLDAYNQAGICDSPTGGAVAIARACKVAVSSDLPRSLQSASLLGIGEIVQTDALFREIELPYVGAASPRLSANTWFLLFRLSWFVGMSNNGISLQQARQRASIGAARLMELSSQHGSVLFVGHGLLNRFISHQLLSHGWQGPKSPGTRHWAYAVYHRQLPA